MISLMELVNFNGNKNTEVLKCNNKVAKFYSQEDTFSNIYGCLCGGDAEGLLIEESQDCLFEISKIKVVDSNPTLAILLQDGKEFTVGIKNGVEGCNTISKHYDFNTLIISDRRCAL